MRDLTKRKGLVRLDIDDLKDISGGTIFWAKNGNDLVYFVRGKLYDHLFSAVRAEKEVTNGRPTEVCWCHSVFEARSASLKEMQQMGL